MNTPDSLPRRTVDRWRVPAAFAVLYFGWGGAYLAARFSIETIPPLLSSGAGFVTAGLLLVAWTVWTQGLPSQRDCRRAAILGAFMILGGMGGTIWAQQRVASGLAALIVSAEPLWMALYEWMFEHRRPTLWMLAGLVSGFAGLVCLAAPGSTSEVDQTGLIVLLAAAFLWVVGALLSRRLQSGRSEVQATGMYMFAGGIELLAASGCSGEWARFQASHLSLRSVLGWSYNTFFSSLVGFTAYIWLLRVRRVTLVSTYAFVNPVIALLLGWALARETLSWRTGLASGLLILGVATLTLAQPAHGSSRLKS